MDLESTEFTELEDALDALEWGDGEFEERRGRGMPRITRRPAPVKRPSGGRLAPTPPSQGNVTRNEFNAAMERVRRELAATSSGLRTLEGRVNTLNAGQERLLREVTSRKREVETVQRDLRQTREMAALLPLLTSTTKTETIPVAEDIPPVLQGKKYLVPSESNLAAFAPLLLLGAGDSSRGGSGGLGGSDFSTLLVAMLAMQK